MDLEQKKLSWILDERKPLAEGNERGFTPRAVERRRGNLGDYSTDLANGSGQKDQAGSRK